MFPLFVAISMNIAAQNVPPAAVLLQDPALVKVCAQILRAAKQRDFALLMPVLAEEVDIEAHETRPRGAIQALLQTWPEDFGPAFWRELADAVRSGVEQEVDGMAWAPPGRERESGVRVYFERIDDTWKVSAIAAMGKDERKKIMPVDVAASDPGLATVRAQIKRAVARRDVDMLLPILGPQIQIDFDAVYTPSEFVAFQKTCQGDACVEFWRQLHDAISLGMAKHPDDADEDVFAPYVFIKADGGPETLTITGDRVALRAAPDTDAPPIEWLSYDVVTLKPGDVWEDRSRPLRTGEFEYGWRPVVSPSGTPGWVSEKYARTAIDTRLWFKKIDGKWKLVAITAGD